MLFEQLHHACHYCFLLYLGMYVIQFLEMAVFAMCLKTSYKSIKRKSSLGKGLLGKLLSVRRR